MNEHVHKKLCVKSQPWKDAEVICNHLVNGYYRNSATKHWMSQKFCSHSVTRCRRKFCDHSVTCGKNFAITQYHVVAEILRPLSQRLSLKFRNHPATRCRRNSGNTHQVVNTVYVYSLFSNLTKTSQ